MTTTETSSSVYLAASPGPLREALFALLLSLPRVASVQTSDLPAEVLHTAAANPSGLVIIVMKADPIWAELPAKIRAAVPGSRLIVLANGETEFYKADLVLQQGVRPEILVAALLSMLE